MTQVMCSFASLNCDENRGSFIIPSQPQEDGARKPQDAKSPHLQDFGSRPLLVSHVTRLVTQGLASEMTAMAAPRGQATAVGY